MIERITVELTPDELWALDTVAVYALERRTMPAHIEMDVRPKLGSAIKALRDAEGRRLTDDALIHDLNIKGATEADTDALRAKWESVPWAAIKRMLGDIGCAERATLNSTMDDFSDVLNWWIANAPKPEAAE
jgi:hypothetical protein